MELNQRTNLLATIRHEAEQLLLEHEVYEIHNYAWLDYDTPDPKYVGHAMQEVSPPFDLDWEGLLNGRAVTYAPTERDKTLLLNGEDFVGTMSFARRSLGTALCYASVAKSDSLFGENLEFWQEYATTLQWLNIASDRLRDYFLMARFGQTNEEYKKSCKKRTKNKEWAYAAPFEERLEGAPDKTENILTGLSGIASKLQKHRADRNSIVHDVATQMAKASITILHDQQKLAGGETTRSTNSLDTLTSAIPNMKRWYIELIEASDLVFRFEYFSRNQLKDS